MATLLAHIQVKEGRESEFEAIAADLYRETHANEPACLRYEYWRGAEPGHYYSLLSFEDFHAFLRHQTSDHHEVASPRIGDTWQALPASADEKTTRYHEVFAAVVQEWWPR
jgi:quinol monooxygenase YgiN